MATIDEDQLIADFVEHFQLDVKRTARRNTRLNKEALLPCIRDYLNRKEEEEYEDDDDEYDYYDDYSDSETSAYGDHEDPDTIPGMYGDDSAHPVRVLGDDTAERKAGSNTQLPSPPSTASSSPRLWGGTAEVKVTPKIIAMVPSVRAIVDPPARGGGSSRGGDLNDGGRTPGRVQGGTKRELYVPRYRGSPTEKAQHQAPTSIAGSSRDGEEEDGGARVFGRVQGGTREGVYVPRYRGSGPTGGVRVGTQEGQGRIRVKGPTGTVSVIPRDDRGEQARQILARGPTGSVRIAPRDVQQRHERPIRVKGPTGSAKIAPRTPEQTQLQTPPPSPPHLYGVASQAPYAPHFMLQEPLYFQLPFHVMKAVVSRKSHYPLPPAPEPPVCWECAYPTRRSLTSPRNRNGNAGRPYDWCPKWWLHEDGDTKFLAFNDYVGNSVTHPWCCCGTPSKLVVKNPRCPGWREVFLSCRLGWCEFVRGAGWVEERHLGWLRKEGIC